MMMSLLFDNLGGPQLRATEFGEETPQLLVMPSALKEMIEPVRGTLVVNPSTLVRFGKGAGTFAVSLISR
jgi:hypothetical protein